MLNGTMKPDEHPANDGGFGNSGFGDGGFGAPQASSFA